MSDEIVNSLVDFGGSELWGKISFFFILLFIKIEGGYKIKGVNCRGRWRHQ